MSWLESKYIHIVGPSLQLFKPLKVNLWNFRCPICGDSEKDRTKCRGYIYFDSEKNRYKFKCHNCGANHTFTWFLKYINPDLHKEYKLEYVKEMGFSKRKRTKKPVTSQKKRTGHKTGQTTTRKVPKLLQNFECVADLPTGHLVRKYAASRKIPKSQWSRLYWANEMKDVADHLAGYEETYFDSYPRLLLPFITKDGILSHIQGRGIGDKVKKGARYYTLECEIGYPKVFGMDQLNDDKTKLVVEGPIDSLFLDNCVGMGGSDMPWDLFSPDSTVFVFDNEPRSPIITKKMTEAAKRGFGVCVWGNNITQKDINDIAKSGRSKQWMHDYITDHTFRGMKAKMAISKYSIRK